MLGTLLGGFIIIVIGLALLPSVASQVAGAQADENITGAANTVVGLTTLFFSLGIMTAGVGLAVSGLRQVGLA